MEMTVKGLLDEKARMLAMLSDIHRHLAAGKTIAPNNKSVLFDPEDFADAPTLTELLGAMLDELGAKDFLRSWK